MTYSMPHPWYLKRWVMAMGGHRGWKGWGYAPGGEFPMGPGPVYMGRPKAGRGDVRLAILHLLSESPMHGYQIMQELAERTHGVWRPSPGAIYPTLQQLEDEGLVHADERDGKKVYGLTEQGRNVVDEAGTPPWERFDHQVDDDMMALRDVGFQVGAAVMQVARAGSRSQVVKTKDILDEARRQIYQILAEDAQD